jgi:hypothetical protein
MRSQAARVSVGVGAKASDRGGGGGRGVRWSGRFCKDTLKTDPRGCTRRVKGLSGEWLRKKRQCSEGYELKVDGVEYSF